MNREIKFRGRRLDTGEWVYGYLVSGNYEPRLKNYTRTWIMHFGRLQGGLKKYEVDPATVGQYTGLKDKIGLEIYENDIVTITYKSKKLVQANDGEFDSELITAQAIVKYLTIGNKQWLDYSITSDSGSNIGISNPNSVEVIGNIHDNPELLKEKQ